MPLRIFIKNYENMIQKSVPYTDEEGGELTIGGYFKKNFPQIKLHWDKAEEGERVYQLISHGVLLDASYLITSIADTFYSLDGFVYISLYYKD